MSSLSITLLNASFFAGSKQISNFIPNGVEQVVLYVQVNNTGEDAFDTRLTVTVERDLFKIASVSRMDCREVDSPENDTSLLSKECSIGNPIKSGTNVSWCLLETCIFCVFYPVCYCTMTDFKDPTCW